MSEYCYQCERCGSFSEDCRCKEGFQDPMAMWKEMSEEELKQEFRRGFERDE